MSQIKILLYKRYILLIYIVQGGARNISVSGVNSPNWHRWVASRVWQYAAACTKVHWRTRRSFSAPSL